MKMNHGRVIMMKRVKCEVVTSLTAKNGIKWTGCMYDHSPWKGLMNVRPA
jgi:hypothetical protein